MNTKEFRKELSLSCAASQFSLYSDYRNRGPNWKLSEMCTYITRDIETQAFVNSIPRKYNEEMINDALCFYRRHLEKALEMLIDS